MEIGKINLTLYYYGGLEMEMEVEIKGVKTKLQINNPKGRHQRQYLNRVSSLGSENNPDANSMKEFLDWRDKLIVDLCPGIKIEDIDEMSMEDLSKIMTWIVSKFKILGDVEKN